MDLFKFLPGYFSDSREYDALNNNERSKFFFMTNRFMAIKFPHLANVFNHLEINSGQAIHSWHDLVKKSGAIPGWLWSGIKGKKAKEAAKPIDCSNELELLYCQVNDITYKEFNRLVELYPKELQIELDEISESLSNNYELQST